MATHQQKQKDASNEEEGFKFYDFILFFALYVESLDLIEQFTAPKWEAY